MAGLETETPIQSAGAPVKTKREEAAPNQGDEVLTGLTRKICQNKAVPLIHNCACRGREEESLHR